MSLVAAASTCTSGAAAAEPAAKPDAKFPGIPTGIAEGWPVILRGAVTGVPVAADLDGDGRLEVIAPAMQRSWDRGLASPDPTIAAQLWALHADGTALEGWPLTLKTVEERQEARRDQGGGTSENWYVSPSVCDVDGDGVHEIVINTGGHNWRDAPRHNVALLYGDGTRVSLGNGADAWASVPLADLDGDCVLDVVVQEVARDVLGRELKDWPQDKRLRSIYQPAIGDTDNDGRPELFVPFMDKDWFEPGSARERTIGGFSLGAKPRPGWPKKLPVIAIYAVMGDVTGDSKKEILSVDTSSTLHVWNADGTAVELDATPDEGSAGGEAGRALCTSLDASAPLCLADLDGDGQAEILALNRTLSDVYALRGDGRPFAFATPTRDAVEPLETFSVRDLKTGKMRELDPKIPADRKRLEKVAATRARLFPPRAGLVASLPPGNAGSHCTVTAVDLSGDGAMDIFVGTQWIRLGRDGKTKITEMLPPEQRGGATNDAGCSIVDLEGDGDAEVIFGLSDGRLFVYRTGQSLTPQNAQWPTWSGNFQHTGAWTRR